MRAKVVGDVSFNSLTAEIVSVSHDRPTLVENFIFENENWIVKTDNLDAGLYRIKVQTDNTSEDALNPVHDLFEVVDLGE